MAQHGDQFTQQPFVTWYITYSMYGRSALMVILHYMLAKELLTENTYGNSLGASHRQIGVLFEKGYF